MNLFILDNDINTNVIYHCDSHVRKLILESAQMLCTAINLSGKQAPYKSTHINHPVCQWVRERQFNYWWTCEYGLALCHEFEYRFNKKHKTQDIIRWCFDIKNCPIIDFTDDQSPFVLAMPDKYKKECPVSSYREYYNCEKRHIFKWTKRDVPSWVTNV